MRFERREILLFGIAQAQTGCVSSLFLVKPFVESLLERRGGNKISLLSSLAKNGKAQLFQAAKIV